MPTIAKEYDTEVVKSLAARGLSIEQCAAALGCHRNTVGLRLNNDSAFRAAFEEGQAQLANEVGGLLLEAARDGSVDSMKFLASSRLGWNKTSKLEHSGEVNAPSIIINMPPGFSPDF